MKKIKYVKDLPKVEVCIDQMFAGEAIIIAGEVVPILESRSRSFLVLTNSPRGQTPYRWFLPKHEEGRSFIRQSLNPNWRKE